MARKTKAELAAEREAFLAAQEAEARASYPARLMAALERLHKLGGDVFVQNKLFNVKILNNGTFSLDYDYNRVTDNELYDLEVVLNREEARVAEAERKAMLRSAALNKLSAEEREVLGI